MAKANNLKLLEPLITGQSLLAYLSFLCILRSLMSNTPQAVYMMQIGAHIVSSCLTYLPLGGEITLRQELCFSAFFFLEKHHAKPTF